MNEQHERYLQDLRARHAADIAALERCLAGRHPEILRDFKRKKARIQRETERILRMGSKMPGKRCANAFSGPKSGLPISEGGED